MAVTTRTGPASPTDAGTCRVCHTPVRVGEGGARRLSGRFYCADDIERISGENRAALGPVLIEIAGVVILAALVAVLAGALGGGQPAEGPGYLVAGLLLALVPAALWLVAFYRQDRLEPEPKHLVMGLFLLGAVLALAISQPITRGFFDVDSWLYDAPVLLGLLASILIVGVVQEALKYAAIRFTVYHAAEFDERVDGIIYGAAVGLGFATALNINYVWTNGGVNLGVGAIQVAVNALAHASFTGILGYFLARAKFEAMGPIWLPAGLLLAATFNGLASYALRQLPMMSGFGYNPWLGLAAAALLAGVVFAGLFSLIRRENRATLASLRSELAGAAQPSRP